MPRPKRGEPELLLVSFCDIVTITTCAMFMAMIIVIDEASKIPVVSPVPILRPTTNAPVYFECHDNKLFPIDLPALSEEFAKHAEEFKKSKGSAGIEKLMAMDAGNETYRLDPGLASMGELGLYLRPASKGIAYTDIYNDMGNAYVANNPLEKMLLNLNHKSQYCVFFVRDNSFTIFRKCRELVVSKGFRHGFEIVAREEPITFEGLMNPHGFE